MLGKLGKLANKKSYDFFNRDFHFDSINNYAKRVGNFLTKERHLPKVNLEGIVKKGIVFAGVGLAALGVGLTLTQTCCDSGKEKSRVGSLSNPSGDDDSFGDIYNGDDDSVGNGGDDTGREDCVIPFSGMVINEDTTLCPGEYHFDEKSQGVLSVLNSNISIYGEGVTFLGDSDMNSRGIFLGPSLENIQIKGITLKNYGWGVYGSGRFNNIQISNLVVNDCYIPIEIGSDIPSQTSENIVVEDTFVNDSLKTGITFRNARHSTIRRVNSSNKRSGVIESNFILLGGSENLLEYNEVTTTNESGCNAFWLSDSSKNLIQHNSANLSYKDGSHLEKGSSNNVYSDNIFVILNNSSGYSVGIGPDCIGNSFYRNSFQGGNFVDESSSTIFCSGGLENYLTNGAQCSTNPVEDPSRCGSICN